MGRDVPGFRHDREHAQSLHDRLSTDLESSLSAEIEQYLATDKSSTRDRVRLFRFASDLAISSFGNRQVLYERFYASDPLSRARALALIFPKDEAVQRVRNFLECEDDI